MILTEIIQRMPSEMQMTMVEFVEVLRKEFREEFAVRREDLAALQMAVQELADAQRRTEDRLEELAEAQRRTEERLEQLAEAQRRTEERLEQLAEAQRRTEEEFRRYREASEARWAQIEANMARLAEAQRRTEERLEQLAEAQRRTEEEFRRYREASEARFERIETALAQLTEAQRRTEEEFRRYREASEARWAQIEASMARLAEAQRRTEEQLLQLRELAHQQINALWETVKAIREWQKSAEDRLARLDGFYLEYNYERKAPAILGAVLHKVRVVPRDRLEDYVRPLSRQELLDLLRTDIIVRGRVWDVPGDPEVWVAMEVSAVLDESDVARAARRAALLRKAGYVAIPIVAGRELTPEAFQAATIQNVVVLTDGVSRFWKEALTAAGIELPPDWESLQDLQQEPQQEPQ